jgi:hypothetical protein
MHKADAHDDSASSARNDRGEKRMGFSQTTTTHHFLLSADGGVIQVEANGPTDTATRDNIRMHLTHITKAFSSGDFAIPMVVHDTTPPGVPVMKQLKDKIRYKFEETPGGARVVIATADPDALAAVLQFLKFQIAPETRLPSTNASGERIANRYLRASFSAFSRPGTMRTTGPFQNKEAGASFQCAPTGYKIASSQ